VRSYFKIILIVLFVVAYSATSFAQPGGGDGQVFEGEEIDDTTPDAPIDGAIIVLATVGAGLGIKRLYARRK
jgi:hypothetical protein